MSIAEIERFAADLKSNAALRAEAEKHAAEKQHETPLAGAVAFAASKGYAFTADHAKEHIKAKAKAAGKELTDAELDKVAGGLHTFVNSTGSPLTWAALQGLEGGGGAFVGGELGLVGGG